MRRGNVVLISILFLITIIFGLQYAHRTFGLETGILTIPEDWLVKMGFPTDSERTEATLPAPTPVATPEPVVTTPAMGAVLAIPLNVSTEAVTESASQSARRKEFLERLALIEEVKPAGVVLFGTKVAIVDAQRAIADVKRVSSSTLIFVDHEGGTVQRLSGAGFTALPSLRQQCALTTEELRTQIASSAAELSVAGVDVIFAPVVDRATGGVLGNRTCSSSPEENSDTAQVYIDEMSKFSIGVVLKHFPGIGGVTRDLHVSAATTSFSREDILPFALLEQFNENTLPIMVSSVVATQIEGLTAEGDGLPCALSRYCVGMLAESYKDAVLFSDALEMESAGVVPDDFAKVFRSSIDASTSAQINSKELTLAERSVVALEAGIDVLVYGPSVNNDELRESLSALTARHEKGQSMPGSLFSVRYNEAVQKISKWNEARYAR